MATAPAADPRPDEVAPSEIHANRRRARLWCLGAGAVPGVVLGAVLAAAVGWVVGLVVLVVLTVGGGFAVWRSSTSVALRRIGARALSDDEEPRLANVTRGLCATMGLREPGLMILDDPVPNACSLGRDQSDAVVIVTTGLLQRLELVELEGVVAHELAHIKRRDTAMAGVAVTVVGPWCALAGNDRWLHRAVGPGREYRADRVAVSAVRYPPGLAGALARMTEGEAPPPGSAFSGKRATATRWIWVDPMAGSGAAGEPGDLDVTAVRLAALAEW